MKNGVGCLDACCSSAMGEVVEEVTCPYKDVPMAGRELESFWIEVIGFNFPISHGYSNLTKAQFPFFLDLKLLSLQSALLLFKCFQRRQPEGEEVVLIKSSLCFPGTGVLSRCLLLGACSQSAANTEAGFPSPKAQTFLHREL